MVTEQRKEEEIRRLVEETDVKELVEQSFSGKPEERPWPCPGWGP